MICYRFIGDAGAAAVEQALGLFFVWCEMKVGEKDLALAERCDFQSLRLFDLHDHFGLGENVCS